jgi:hypothetical protein
MHIAYLISSIFSLLSLLPELSSLIFSNYHTLLSSDFCPIPCHSFPNITISFSLLDFSSDFHHTSLQHRWFSHRIRNATPKHVVGRCEMSSDSATNSDHLTGFPSHTPSFKCPSWSHGFLQFEHKLCNMPRTTATIGEKTVIRRESEVLVEDNVTNLWGDECNWSESFRLS